MDLRLPKREAPACEAMPPDRTAPVDRPRYAARRRWAIETEPRDPDPHGVACLVIIYCRAGRPSLTHIKSAGGAPASSCRSEALGGLLLASTASFDNFLLTYLLAGSEVTTVPIQIYSMVSFEFTPKIHALSTFIILVSVSLMMLSLLLGRRRRAVAEVKAA